MALNFNDLPDSVKPKVSPGIHPLRIKEVTKTTSENSGSHMLVLKLEVMDSDDAVITDYCALYNDAKEPIQFGQVKLKRLMTATDTIPEGDFSMKLIAQLLEGKTFKAELVEEEYNNKTQIKVGYPETFQPLEEAPTPKPKTSKVKEEADKAVETPEKIKEEDDDDEL